MNLLGKSLLSKQLFMKSQSPAGMVQLWARSFSSAGYENIIAEKKEGGVGFIQLNRPKALNALCDDLFKELIDALETFDNDPEVGAIVITGNEKAFAAGADIKEMKDKQYPETYKLDMLSWWEGVARVRTPTIAAVNGFALGGGCELAMMCDILLAGHKAKFGQPEINLGTIPGMGGTQRLPRAIGKARAMELALTGDFMGAEEAAQKGVAARVVQADELVEDALKVAQKIASKSKPIAMMVKEAVNVSFESSLAEGLRFERRLFHSTFGIKDRKEGMEAFAGKRAPNFTGE